MSWVAVVVFFVVVLPLLGFLLWTVWQESTVRIGQRQIGLVIVRGKPTELALPAGKHFVRPFSQEVEVYPAHELAYMAVPEGMVERMELRDVDYADPPLGVTDAAGTPAGLCYTIRFRVILPQLRQVHERFGAAGIGGIVRDEGRQAIAAYFVEDGHRLLDLLGSARGTVEAELGERVRARLAACGFDLTLFSLQEPDLRGLGQSLQEQMRAREAITLEQIRGQVEEVKDRRWETHSRLETSLEAERIRAQAEAEAAAARLRAEVEATVAEEKVIRRALAAAKSRELEVAKQLQQVDAETELELRRAEGVARWGRALTDSLTPVALEYRALEAWRSALERWDGVTPAVVGQPWPLLLPPVVAQQRSRSLPSTDPAADGDGPAATPR